MINLSVHEKVYNLYGQRAQNSEFTFCARCLSQISNMLKIQ